jgi:hypothetical protein
LNQTERKRPGDTEKALELVAKMHTAAPGRPFRDVERRAATALQLLNT